MKNIFTLIIIFLSTISFGQNIEKEKLWRTKGVYDSLGNFIERAKIQSFLFSSKSNQFYRLRTQDKVNMETGETKVFVYRDTLNLSQSDTKSYKLSDKETLILHSNDSLTIQFNGYTLPYVKLDLKSNKVDLEKLKSELQKEPLIESVEGIKEYQFTYQENELVIVKPLERDSEWESEYKIIDFNGFIIIQGIVSAPKLITKLKKGKISFMEIDYRFKNKNGELNKIR
ncbi:hypothetical protein [Tenacibaculum sp. M341]|uniref:hypothetical protein n=1 Tax=Tenacibaculum sp. M341 TaxID=2530339 RepID=UPI00104BA09F|nr:hypothetical protein [Tenacibaculum sp. M341]TCI90610.1 hypothetical protein EYW44_12850 [Tenacibaculum sp. M341]